MFICVVMENNHNKRKLIGTCIPVTAALSTDVAPIKLQCRHHQFVRKHSHNMEKNNVEGVITAEK